MMRALIASTIARLRASVAVSICGIAFVAVNAHGEVTTYRPRDASLVILRLGDEAQLTRLLREVQANTDDADAWRRYLHALIATGERTGNERYYGYAETALASAPTATQTQLLALRAQLLQHRHDFRAAETTLSELLQREPRNAEALLMRAQIRLHLHDPQNALRDCSQLALLTDLLTSITCTAQGRAALGPELTDVRRAYELVAAMLNTAASTAATRSWSAGVAGELAARLGEDDAAERWYRLAFELNRDNHYARIVYADWLLARGRSDEAHAVASAGAALADRLRAVLAKQSSASDGARQLQLAWREAELRGERTHLRDRARFEWLVLKDVPRAHATALDNFRDQRDIEDALLLAQTAALRGDAKALALVEEWRRTRRYADTRLSKLLENRS